MPTQQSCPESAGLQLRGHLTEDLAKRPSDRSWKCLRHRLERCCNPTGNCCYADAPECVGVTEPRRDLVTATVGCSSTSSGLTVVPLGYARAWSSHADLGPNRPRKPNSDSLRPQSTTGRRHGMIVSNLARQSVSATRGRCHTTTTCCASGVADYSRVPGNLAVYDPAPGCR